MVFSTLVVSIEILGQFGYFIKTGEFLPLKAKPVHKNVFEIHPFLVGRLKASVEVKKNNKTITTPSNHTRWTGSQQDDHDLIRIAILGGSTVFGVGVTDQDSWPALLQEKLGKQYAVINYGVPGYSTAENIIQMALIVPEKRPNIVIYYEGWNDIRNYHEKNLGADYYGHGMRQYGNLAISNFEQETTFDSLKDIFATVRMAYRIMIIIGSFQEQTKETFEVFDTPDPFVDKIYIRNLHTLKILAENIDAYAVFIPQVLNYTSYYGKSGSREWSRHIKDEAMPVLMGKFNEKMNGVCSKGEKTCVVLSEVLEEKWQPDDFVDEGHFSKSGGLKIAKKVAQIIRRTSNSEVFDSDSQYSSKIYRLSTAQDNDR